MKEWLRLLYFVDVGELSTIDMAIAEPVPSKGADFKVGQPQTSLVLDANFTSIIALINLLFSSMSQ